MLTRKDFVLIFFFSVPFPRNSAIFPFLFQSTEMWIIYSLSVFTGKRDRKQSLYHYNIIEIIEFTGKSTNSIFLLITFPNSKYLAFLSMLLFMKNENFSDKIMCLRKSLRIMDKLTTTKLTWLFDGTTETTNSVNFHVWRVAKWQTMISIFFPLCVGWNDFIGCNIDNIHIIICP